MKRADVEQLRDIIRAAYNINADYLDYEQELMRDLQHERITKNEFMDQLEYLYSKEEEWEAMNND